MPNDRQEFAQLSFAVDTALVDSAVMSIIASSLQCLALLTAKDDGLLLPLE